jgi:2-methylcitrate dehydratase PrpD
MQKCPVLAVNSRLTPSPAANAGRQIKADSSSGKPRQTVRRRTLSERGASDRGAACRVVVMDRVLGRAELARARNTQVAANHHAPPVTQLLAAQASLLGCPKRVDVASAALINGISSHTFDFDDTHLKAIIHCAGPVANALLVLGIDVSCRVGNARYPDHCDRGWHITDSTGTLGAAAVCARLLKLDVQKTAMALGMREQFGTMTKPFHPGGAARAGLMAALLAQHGYTASPRALEAPRGMMQTVSTKNDWSEITGELGQRLEISFNIYKPFACGIVIHPSLDACTQLRAQGVTPALVERIELKVHSLVLELTDKQEPADGLQAKFSVFHGCAAGLTFGRTTEDEYADDIVNRADMVALRRKVVATVDDAIDEASADVTAVLTDGRRFHVFVEHAIGSLAHPSRARRWGGKGTPRLASADCRA